MNDETKVAVARAADKWEQKFLGVLEEKYQTEPSRSQILAEVSGFLTFAETAKIKDVAEGIRYSWDFAGNDTAVIKAFALHITSWH